MGQSDPSLLQVVVFPNTTVLPLHVATEKGFFARQGVAVAITVTPTSTYQITELAGGKFQIAIGAFDNIVAYQEGQGAVQLASPDLFAFMGVARMNLQLVVQPEIRNYEDLRGKSFAVDAPSSGFVYVMRHMLAQGGLGPADYSLAAVGTKRWDALKNREHVGGLLTDSYMAEELAKGLKILENSVDVLPNYQSAVGTACRGWAASHERELVGFIRGMLDALDWIFAPANRDEAAQILARHRDGMSETAARRAVAQLTSDHEGLTRDGSLSEQGMASVVALRDQYGEPKKTLPTPERYVDLSYWQKALSA